ncbi:hypothetical protein GCM10011490_13170 [Pseudoclavibacter endophyticus]|uniref:DUF58 domain-containing protein n=1 Tax=Pseudoclavibacter endophyticus TaxID=1778590 RepID=A0A6H9WQN4_9MICO|nr:DUF58 domain-containing protein [Pseudoclavibacter endophyticus]KAB1649277.1 DUF58 domain-containing protein [Pseudoclavibacter endophyticus]GGA63909.1 hypothetical protein GCM10011490_13170 [Pseudoclavibacter endophyticus]
MTAPAPAPHRVAQQTPSDAEAPRAAAEPGVAPVSADAPARATETGGAAEALRVERDRFEGLVTVARVAWAWMREHGRTLWERISPVIRVITTLAWVLIGAGAVLLVAGAWLGWIELLVLGGVALVMVLVAVPFAFGRAVYEVEIELNPRRVTVGDRALGRLTVRNAGERRALPTRMEFPVGKGRAEFGIPLLRPGQSHEELFSVPTTRRAVIPAGPARSIRGDELGILRRTVKWTGVIDLFVHPRTVRLESSAAGLLRDLEGVTTTKITDHDLAFHALRPYEPGDDLRHVHWKTTARTGTLMVRQFEETRRSQITIVHTLDRSRYRSEEEFELSISVFASIVQQVLREDLDIEAVNELGALPTRSIVAMLDATSRFDVVEPEHPSFRSYVSEATRRLSPPTVVIFVGGSGLSPSDLHRARSLFPHEVSVTAFRCDTEARVSRRQLGQLTIGTVSKLGDLPRLLRGKGLV